MGTFNVFSYLDPALVKEEMGDPYASKTPGRMAVGGFGRACG